MEVRVWHDEGLRFERTGRLDQGHIRDCCGNCGCKEEHHA